MSINFLFQLFHSHTHITKARITSRLEDN